MTQPGTQTKKIIIAIAGAEGQDYKDVELLPATQPRDVLNKLGLHKFELSKPEGGFFGREDDLYAGVADGQKIYAVIPPVAG